MLLADRWSRPRLNGLFMAKAVPNSLAGSVFYNFMFSLLENFQKSRWRRLDSALCPAIVKKP
jgi:hypothetical protein